MIFDRKAQLTNSTIKKSKNPDKILWGYLLRIEQENTGKDVSFIKIFAIKGTYEGQ